jgi:hypothetical protein
VYDGGVPASKESAKMSKTSKAWYDIVEFVEDHGGSLGGEDRDKLNKIVLAYAVLVMSEKRS